MAASSNIYYSPDSLRVSKTVNGETTTHVLDGANVVADIQGTSISKYNRGRGLISIEQGANKGYYVFNGHGDITSIVDGSGTKSKGYYFSAYGENMMETGSGQFANPFGYAGEYTDEETGNICLRARYYDPSTGRFMSEEPIKDGTNWYAYAGNNPVLYVDPTGLWMEGDERFKNSNPIVYNALNDLSNAWAQLDNLEKTQSLDPKIDIQSMKNDVATLANKVR